MQACIHQKVHFIGSASQESSPTPNSLKLASTKGLSKAASMGFIRVAGNVFECPSTQDLWKVSGDKVIRMSSTEVDNNEKLKPATGNPKEYLDELLADLHF